jgi:hypothetical protein
MFTTPKVVWIADQRNHFSIGRNVSPLIRDPNRGYAAAAAGGCPGSGS